MLEMRFREGTRRPAQTSIPHHVALIHHYNRSAEWAMP
jgi:hypothetical protein